MKVFFSGVIYCCLALGVSAAPAQNPPRYVEGEVIVRLKPSADLPAAERKFGGRRMAFKRHFGAISKVRGRHYGLIRGTNMTTLALIAELKQDSDVETVEPNYIASVEAPLSVNDTRFPELWGLQNGGQAVQGQAGTAGADISFNTAWGLAGVNTNEVVVAVLDTGTDINHPDLASNIWTNPFEAGPANGEDEDNNGYADDFHGWDFADVEPDISDSGSHGTHVAGTIAASGNNSFGVIGVDFLAKIMTLKASNDGHFFTYSALIDAINYATMMRLRGINIVAINASLGGPSFSSALLDSIQAAGDVGIIFCAAAGNDAADNDLIPTYPASYRLTNMIVVAAMENRDLLAFFSNFGSNTVDIAAPGNEILSTMPLAPFANSSTVAAALRQNGNVYTVTTYQNSPAGAIAGTILDCGVGQTYQIPPYVNGNIALLKRGTISDDQKLANVAAAGAKGAIIYNNVSGSFTGTAASAIPTVAMSQADAIALRPTIPAHAALSIIRTYQSTNNFLQAYDYKSGTSMATPHVAGAVAFAAMNYPAQPMLERIQRILTNADVVLALSTNNYTVAGRRLNINHIVDSNGDSIPDWWDSGMLGTNVIMSADPDGDGVTTEGELAAGTDPAKSSSVLRVVDVASSDTQVSVTWNSEPTRRYFLQRTTNSFGGGYTTVATNVPGQVGTTSFTESRSQSSPTYYYRVGISQ